MNNNVQLILEIGGHLCSRGIDEYTSFESKRRAECVFRYLVNEGISEKRLTIVGYGEINPIAPNQNPDGSDNPDGRQINRRIELKILKASQTFRLTDTVFNVGDVFIAEKIYFDFDQWNIRIESYPQLDSISDFLKKNKTIVLEIGSHLSGRGTNDYITKIAINRAKAIKKHLVKSGVKSKVMKIMGYCHRFPQNEGELQTERDLIRSLSEEEARLYYEKMDKEQRMSRRIELKILKVDL
jgi:outer membrane protein OmpA-like peptidoglycan-associated protein